MTSTASQQTQIPAPNQPAASTTSYASAAGATKKPATPLIATGSNPPPVVVGSSAPQHGKSSSISPVNGRPSITPAVPTVSAAPAVAHGSSNMNGNSSDHSRKPSVTISANGPNSYAANGGPVGGAKAGIQFGFSDSPAMQHSTPQPTTAAPIPIPGNSNPRVQSPAHSPSPIPQPSASGGKPPSTGPDGGFRIGSFGGDGERHMRPGSISQNAGIALGSQSPHMRHNSQHSDMGNHGNQGPNRGGFSQGGRGRGSFNPQYGQQMGFPPNGGQYPRGPSQGRGGMPPQYGGRPGMQPYPNSPQPARGSPALPPSMPNQGTPTMAPAMPIPPNHGFQHQYPPPMGTGYPPQNYGAYPQMDHMGRPLSMGYPTYPPQMHYMNAPPQSPSPAGFANPYVPNQYAPPPQAQPMSRNSSQISERPASSTGQSQPVIAQGTPQLHNAQPKAPVVASSPAFVRPKKSAAIVIKNAAGEEVNFSNIKAPASPAPSIQQSKTPPVVASTPTPPPKPSTPAAATHARTDSAATGKSAEQLRKEFQEQVRKQAEAPSEVKAKEEEAAKAAADKAAAEKAAAEKAAAEEKAKEEERIKQEELAKAEQKAKEEAEAKAAQEAKDKAEAEAKAKADAEAEAAKKEEKKDDGAMDDEELERIIREMEEEDARREQEQAAISAKKAQEKAEAKKNADAQKATEAADNDRKLREQEREMERLEEERERQRKENESKGTSKSVAELLTEKISDLTLSDKKDSAGAVADKLANLSLESGDGASPTTATKPHTTEKRAKPAALNLTPLNTKPVEPPQPSAALQSLKTSRFLSVRDEVKYPMGINSPNPALNAAVAKKGKAFKYDSAFLLQFQKVFTEEPSMEFHQQVKTLIGDSEGGRSQSARTPGGAGSGRQNSRTGAPGFPAMGSFGAPGAGGKPLPPGTTSEQRFAMSQGNMARPNINPMASFQRPGGAFPGSSQMSRTPSSSNMGMPNSPRQGSRSTRAGSKRAGYDTQNDAKAAKTMPLTQGMDLKPITTSATGWKPTSIGSKAGPPATSVTSGGALDPAMVQRKVKAALNKMTPENFDRISEQILTIAAQSKDEQDGRTLRQVIQLTFEKATDEAHWASMYAKFCKRMLETMSPEIRDVTILDKNGNVVSGGALFRKYLLNRCQEEFERGWQVDLPQPKEGESKEAALLSDEYYIAAAAKRRGLGLVQFIGELYKLGMLTERIMHECVRKLLDFNGIPDEAEIESLSKLLRTIGGNLDATEKGRPMMDAYFGRIQTIVDMPDLPSRLKFMLMDVVDLRRVHWVTKEGLKGPKTLEEIRAEAEAQAAQKAAENARSSQRGGPGRAPMGRGDARNFSYNQPAPNQVGMDDLRRLKGSASRTASQNVTLGPTSMFSSRSNSGRRLGPGGALNRAGEESGASSRTGTPPTREAASHTNAFAALANMEPEHPASPPSTAASPALAKVTPDSDKKESA